MDFRETGNSMAALGSKPPVVKCPGCGTAMTDVEHKPILSTSGLADVTYRCERCGTTTIRTLCDGNTPLTRPPVAP